MRSTNAKRVTTLRWRCVLALVCALTGCDSPGGDGRGVGDAGGDDDPSPASRPPPEHTDEAGLPASADGWTTVESDARGRLLGLWGSSGTDIWAVGEDGTVLHFDGRDWSSVDSGTDASLHDVWGTSADDVWAVGGVWSGDSGTGTILHFDGTEWTTELDDAPQPLVAIWGSSATDVITVGGADAGGLLLRFDGSSWEPMDGPPDGEDSYGNSWSGSDLWGSGPDGLFLTTFNAVSRHDGSDWQVLSHGLASSEPAQTVWGTSSTNVYVGHLIGGIHHWDGGVWSEVWKREPDSGHVNVNGLWGDSPSNVYAVGGNWGKTDTVPAHGFADGAIITHFDGNTWSDYDVRDLSVGLNAVWGSSDSGIWTVGDEGTLLHHR